MHWIRDRLPTPVLLGFPSGSAGKESACKAGDLGSSLGWKDPLEKGKGYPLQYSDLENSMDCTVHAVAQSRTRLSDTCLFKIYIYVYVYMSIYLCICEQVNCSHFLFEPWGYPYPNQKMSELV